MRTRSVVACTLVVLYGVAALIFGCSTKPTVCTVTPIDIEELKADSRDLDEELAATRERLAQARADLAGWEQRVADLREQPPQLRQDLARLKKQYGLKEELAETGAEAKKAEQATLPVGQ